eukprot:6205524-Pleurochrysis_carterae.AAC.2
MRERETKPCDDDALKRMHLSHTSSMISFDVRLFTCADDKYGNFGSDVDSCMSLSSLKPTSLNFQGSTMTPCALRAGPSK